MAIDAHVLSDFPFVWQGSQLFLENFPVLGLPDEGRSVKYISLNPFLPNAQNRCPLDCAYCVCHQDAGWHHTPERFGQAVDEEQLLTHLLDVVVASAVGQRGVPISLCDYSDPFIPAHRERVLATLDGLIARQAANLIYITTKVHPGRRFLERLQATLSQPHALRPTVFVSLPPLQPGYEPVSINARVRLLKDLTALGIPCCWYLRPLAEAWYDEQLFYQLARELLPHVTHHVVLSGVVLSPEIEGSLLARGLAVPQWDRSQPGKKQYLTPAFEQRLRRVLNQVAGELGLALGPVMGHRLCGTNGNHAYGCLLCAKQNRHCQLFQTWHYGATIHEENPEGLRLRLQKA